VAIAGPATSSLISLFFLGLWLISNSLNFTILTPLIFLLFFWNLLLAVFNLFPGYPLDGGRVLRAILWKRGNNLNEATILTGKAGQIIGICLIVIGLIIVIGRADIFTSLWTVIVGFFLFDAASGVIRESTRQEDVKVGEVMSPPFSVSLDDNIRHFVDNILPQHRLSAFLVAKDREFYGVLLLEDLKQLDESKWHKTKIAKIMRPVTPDYFVESDFLLNDAKELMKHNGINALGITDADGNLVGYLQRGKIRKVR
jgi:CBS domain-containing protein